jgi:hypothetical protein
MVKKQTKASRLQAAKKKKQVQETPHDTEATDHDVDSPDLHDKVPAPPNDAPDTQEKAPDPQDENPDLEKGKKTTDEDNDIPTVSDRNSATNMGKPTDVGTGVAVGDNSTFTIDDTTTDERVETVNVSNVDDVVNPHVNNGDESTIPDKGTDDEQVLDAAIPWNKPSIPMVPEPRVPKKSKIKLSPLLYVHFIPFNLNRQPADD